MPAVFALRANRDDYRGTLSWQLGDPGGRPLSPTPLVRSLDYSRPATLPKQQWRQFEISFLSPAAGPFRLAPQLRSAGLGPGFDLTSPVVRSMPLQMYELLVLAADPLDYRGLANLNMVEFSSQSIDENDSGTANPPITRSCFPRKKTLRYRAACCIGRRSRSSCGTIMTPRNSPPTSRPHCSIGCIGAGNSFLAGPTRSRPSPIVSSSHTCPPPRENRSRWIANNSPFLISGRGATRVKRCKSSSRGQASNWCRMQQRSGSRRSRVA